MLFSEMQLVGVQLQDFWVMKSSKFSSYLLLPFGAATVKNRENFPLNWNMSLAENHPPIFLALSSSLLFVHISAYVCLHVEVALHCRSCFYLLIKIRRVSKLFSSLSIESDRLMHGSCREIWLSGKSLRAGQGFRRCKSDLLILSLCPERM